MIRVNHSLFDTTTQLRERSAQAPRPTGWVLRLALSLSLSRSVCVFVRTSKQLCTIELGNVIFIYFGAPMKIFNAGLVLSLHH